MLGNGRKGLCRERERERERERDLVITMAISIFQTFRVSDFKRVLCCKFNT